MRQLQETITTKVHETILHHARALTTLILIAIKTISLEWMTWTVNQRIVIKLVLIIISWAMWRISISLALIATTFRKWVVFQSSGRFVSPRMTLCVSFVARHWLNDVSDLSICCDWNVRDPCIYYIVRVLLLSGLHLLSCNPLVPSHSLCLASLGSNCDALCDTVSEPRNECSW